MGFELIDASTFDFDMAERVTPEWQTLFSCMQ